MPKFLTMIVAVFFGILLCSSTFVKPAYSYNFFSNNDVGSSTLNYWKKLNSIEIESDLSPCEAFKDYKNKKVDETAMNSLKNCFSSLALARREFASGIGRLSTLNVDEEALSFSSFLMDQTISGAKNLDQILSYIAKKQNEDSPWTTVFYVLRGLAGDPTTVIDAIIHSKEYMSRLSKMENEFNLWLKTREECKSLEKKVRESLSQKYHREFSPLEYYF